MNKAVEVLQFAEEQAQSVASWADLSNALFDPINGKVAKAFATRAEREEFVQTEEYRKIRGLITAARQRFGLVPGATPRANGQLLVQVPASLHAALEREAIAEGMSLNQLVIAKLAASLSELVHT